MSYVISFFEWFGDLGIFVGRTAKSVFVRPVEFREFVRQLDAIGSKSLPLVALAGAATGVVLSLQTRDSLTRFGAKSLLPEVIVFSLIRESGPVITGLVSEWTRGRGHWRRARIDASDRADRRHGSLRR